MNNDKTLRNAEQAIHKALSEIRYGSLEITIHDSRIVQIERKEKIRIEPNTDRK